MAGRLALLVGALLLVAACGGGGATISTTALPKLVLQPSDLGSAYQQFQAGKQALADAPANAGGPQRFGREAGWIARYRILRGKGPALVESRADVFRSSNGAAKEVSAYAGRFPAATARPAVKGLGQRAAAYVVVQGALRTVVVVWQERNAAASVSAQGVAATTTLPAVLRLARRQERLLQAAAR